MKIINGWAFPDADFFMVSQMANDGTYQKSHLDAAMRWVKKRGPMKLAIDGGAHVGAWSKFMAQDFEVLYSFEPSHDTFEALTYNMRGVTNVHLRNQAIGAAPGLIHMTLGDIMKNIEAKNTGARFIEEGEGSDIERITIDSLELPALDFLKMDIEGSEPNALAGARETLIKYKPIVLFEDKNFWMRFGFSKRAPHEFLESIGAHHLERTQMDEIWGWV